MKKLHYIISLIFVLFIALAACNSNEAKEHASTDSVSFKNEAFSIIPGETMQLECEVSPPNAKIEYSSSNSEVLTVNEQGVVLGVGPGNATVVASIGEYTKDYLEVTVKKDVMISQTSLMLNVEELELISGLDFDLAYSVKYNGESVSETQAVWTSSNEMVATVAEGKVYAVAPGNSVITVSVTVNGEVINKQCSVTVHEYYRIELDKEKIESSIGQSFGLKVSVYNANGIPITPKPDELEWITSDPQAIEINNGSFKVVSKGAPSVGVRYKGNVASIPVEIFCVTADFFKESTKDFYGVVDNEKFSGVLYESAAYQPVFHFSEQGISKIQQYAKEKGFVTLRIHSYAILLNNTFRINSRYVPAENWTISDIPISELSNDFYFQSESEGTTEVYMWFEFR